MSDGPYLPGRTARPPEGAFDHLKLVSEPLADCLAWQEGLRFYRAGFYWEAHEVWEAVWLAAPERSPEKVMVQGAIQLANAQLKRLLGRDGAAQRLEGMAWQLLAEGWQRGGPEVMGLKVPRRNGSVHYSADALFKCEL